MRYLNENFEQAVNVNSKFKAMIENMKTEVNSFYGSFHDDPSIISEWGHYYFCNDDGGRLIFDINNPKSHVCTICKKDFKNEVYDGVWTYFYRNEAVLTALKSAVLYAYYKDDKYLDIIKNILGFYAKNYLSFKIHNKERQVFDSYEEMTWGCGRILPQGLNESIIAIRMINALEIVKNDIGQEFLDYVYEHMFKEMYRLLRPQVNQIHNIRCWNNSAIGVIGLFFNDKEMIDFAFEGEYNINRQLEVGVTKDYFWYEGSIHYNFFTLEGVTNLLIFAKLYNHEFKTESIIEHMFIEAYNYAFSNQYFPNPNDGWPSINLKTYSYIYQMAVKCFGYDSLVGNILKNILNDPNPRTTLPLSKPYYFDNDVSYEHLVLNTDFDYVNYKKVPQSTRNYPISQFGMLRNNNFNIFMKYGLNGPSHAHPDIMNVEITYKSYLITRDMSNPGYQSRLYKEWFKKTVSHNTVVTDYKNITKTSRAEENDYSSNMIMAKSQDVYAGVDYQRKIILNDDGFEDEFVVTSSEEHNYDYVFHIEKEFELISNLKLENTDIGYDDNGYQFFQDVNKINKFDGKLVFKRNNELFVFTIDSKDKDVYIMKSYDNPIDHVRTTIIVRKYGTNTKFKLKMEVK